MGESAAGGVAGWLPPEAWHGIGRAVSALADGALKATLVVLAAAVVVRALRGAAPGLRHAVWAGALGVVLLLPLVPGILPWRLVELDLPRIEVPVDGIDGPGASSDPPWGRSGGTVSPWDGDGTASGPPGAPGPSDDGRVPDGGSEGASALASGRRSEGRGAAGWIAATYLGLLAIWLGGLALRLAREAAGWIGLAWITREASPASGGGWPAALREARERVGLKRRVRLRLTSRVSVPMTWGIARPVVLLPEDAGEWPSRRLGAALTHELAHLRRRDPATHLVASLAEAAFWFHPGVRRAADLLRLEAERACDAAVLEAGMPGTEYARHLLVLLRAVRRGPPRPVPAAVAPRGLEERLRATLSERSGESPSTLRLGAVWAAAGALFLLSPLATVGGGVPAGRETTAAPERAATRPPEPTAGSKTVAGSPPEASVRAARERDGPRGTVRWREADRRVEVSWSLEREAVPSRDGRSITALAPGAFVSFSVLEGGQRLDLDLVGTRGGVLLEGELDGRPLGPRLAVRLLAAVLPGALSRTPIGVEARASRARARGGLEEALIEAGALRTDWARKRYLDELLEEAPPIARAAPEPRAVEERLAVLEAAERLLEGQGWRGRFLWQRADDYLAHPETRRPYVEAVRSLTDPDDLAAVLSRILDHGSLGSGGRAALLEAAEAANERGGGLDRILDGARRRGWIP